MIGEWSNAYVQVSGQVLGNHGSCCSRWGWKSEAARDGTGQPCGRVREDCVGLVSCVQLRLQIGPAAQPRARAGVLVVRQGEGEVLVLQRGRKKSFQEVLLGEGKQTVLVSRSIFGSAEIA